MATLKYKDVSPYKQAKPQAPVEDYLNALYENDLQANTVLNPKKHNVAVFGLGRAGTIHLSSLALNPRVTIAYIVDDIVAKHKKIQDYYGLHNTKFLTSKQADSVYKDSSVDCVIIATPTYAHEEIVKAALAAKKAVFCEKPISEDREGTARCYQQAKSMGVPLFCAFNRRFDPSYSMVRDRILKGEVGHVQTIKVCSRDSPLPTIDYLKTSGGIFHDCAVHDIDMICWVIGEFPCQVSCIATANVEEIKAIDDFDTVAATLKFPSGTIGMIDLSRNSCYGYDQRLEVFGARGMVRADNEQPVHCITSQTGLGGITSPPIWFSFPSRYRNAYQKEMNHFFDVVEKKCESMVKGVETLAVSKIATAIEESARSGKVVDLKWTSDELS